MHLINKYKVRNKEFTFIEVNQKDIKVTFMDYGATIMSIFVPDESGVMENILLAYNDLESYIENEMYLNATIGPNSGRIKDAKYVINDNEINVEKNFLESENLHSGSDCFAFKFFSYEVKELKDSTKVIFEYHKKESESSFPGNQEIKITYTVSSTQLLIEFEGTTDKDALLNITNHAYFNLSGNIKDKILSHSLQVNSSNYIELDDKFVPYKVSPVNETIFDFKKERDFKETLNEAVYNIPTLGVDHPFILDDVGFEYKQIILKDPISKRELEVYTSYPCIVVYTHNYPDMKDLLFGREHVKHLGICFETQNEPNGINIKGLNNSILKSDEKYYHKTLYRFKISKK
ncbi:MAG: Aldose 1-epimerase precursor [Candidatus Izimaplasma bacterium HR2]|nr:MAG: Aldose 1-epimerase precursor [Candidatus Izimaplasma bacterium HR2]